MKLYKLFTPGPVDVPDEILMQTARPLIYHREEKFKSLASDIVNGLRKILATNNEIFLFTASGTGAMEAACANILCSTDEPIVAVCGKFGERWLNLCSAYGIKPAVIKEEYGKSIRPERIEEALKKNRRRRLIFTTLTETSTGAVNDIKSFGEIAKKSDAILVVDGVAGIGADLCLQDDWHVDILVGASQKALMAPPGISFLSLSKRAFEKSKKSNLPKYYFDLELYEQFSQKGQTPFTPAITILYGLKRGIETILRSGVEENLKRHQRIADYVRKRVQTMGLDIFPEFPANSLTVIKMPENINSTEVITEIKDRYKILFANGQGELRGKIIRVGHMGNYNIKKLSGVLTILEKVLKTRRRL